MAERMEYRLARMMLLHGQINVLDYLLVRGKDLTPAECRKSYRSALVGVRRVLAKCHIDLPSAIRDGDQVYRIADLLPDQKLDVPEAARVALWGIRVTPTRGPKHAKRLMRILQYAQDLDPDSPNVNRFEHHLLLCQEDASLQRLLDVARVSAQRRRSIECDLELLRGVAINPLWQSYYEEVNARILEYEEEYADLTALALSTAERVGMESKASRSHCEFQDLAFLVMLARRQPPHLRLAIINLLPEMPGVSRLCGALTEDVMGFAFAGGKKILDRSDARSIVLSTIFAYLINDLPWHRVGTAGALRTYVRRACGVKAYVACVADALGLDADVVSLVFRKWRHEQNNPGTDIASLPKALGLSSAEWDAIHDRVETTEALMRAESISLSMLIERNAGKDDADKPRTPSHGEDVAVDNRTIEESQVQALLERTPAETIGAFHRWAPLAADARTRKKRVSTRRMRKTLGIDSKQWDELMGFVREFNGLVRDDDFDPEVLTTVG